MKLEIEFLDKIKKNEENYYEIKMESWIIPRQGFEAFQNWNIYQYPGYNRTVRLANEQPQNTQQQAQIVNQLLEYNIADVQNTQRIYSELYRNQMIYGTGMLTVDLPEEENDDE